MNKRPAYQKAFFHAAGEGAVFDVAFIYELKTIQKLIRPTGGLLGENPKVTGLIDQKLMNGKKRVKIKFLGAQANQPPCLDVFRGCIVTEDLDTPLLEIRKARNNIDGGCFSSAIWPQEGKEITAPDFKGDIIQGLKFTVILGQILNGDSSF